MSKSLICRSAFLVAMLSATPAMAQEPGVGIYDSGDGTTKITIRMRGQGLVTNHLVTTQAHDALAPGKAQMIASSWHRRSLQESMQRPEILEIRASR